MGLEHFRKVDIRAATLTEVKPFAKAIKPAYQLRLDVGSVVGSKQSSAQLPLFYTDPDELLHSSQVLCVTNFPPRKVAGFRSEVLTMGLYGTLCAELPVARLARPLHPVPNGSRLMAYQEDNKYCGDDVEAETTIEVLEAANIQKGTVVRVTDSTVIVRGADDQTTECARPSRMPQDLAIGQAVLFLPDSDKLGALLGFRLLDGETRFVCVTCDDPRSVPDGGQLL